MDELLSTTKDFSADVKRNIIDMSEAGHVFDDLMDTPQHSNVADTLIQETRGNMNFSGNLSSFYYTTAIGYPFETIPCMATRYSDGSFPVWYGSLDLQTTIYETVYHMYRSIFAIRNSVTENKIIRKRSVFKVKCNALLIDITQKHSTFPKLHSNDYVFCQSLGQRMSRAGYPGILSISARFDNGINVNIFKPDVLLNSRLDQNLTYTMDLNKNLVNVTNSRRKKIISIALDDLNI